MANEIQASFNLRINDASGVQYFGFSTGQTLFDQAASGGPSPGYITVGTSEESTAFPELTTEGWLFLKNLDSTNYVQFGFSTGVYGIRLKALQWAWMPLEPSLTLYMKANTASCKCLVHGFNA